MSLLLLKLLVLCLGFGQLLRFEFSGVPVFPHDLLIVLLIFLHFRDFGTSLKRTISLGIGFNRSGNWQEKGIVLLILGISLGWIYSLVNLPIGVLYVPFLYTLRLLVYLSLYLTLRQARLRLPAGYFYLSGLITALIGLIQYLYLPDMRIFKYLGWDDHLNRLILPDYDPAFTGTSLSLIFLLFVERFGWLMPMILLVPILLTYSRSVWLSLVSAVLFSLPRSKTVLIVICLILAGYLLLPRRFGEGNNLLRTYSITSRIVSDVQTVRKLGLSNLTGVGMNAISLYFPHSSPYPDRSIGLNNSYLFILSTAGICGLAGLILFLYGLYRSSNHKATILNFMVAGLFNNVIFYPLILIWILTLESTVRVPSGD